MATLKPIGAIKGIGTLIVLAWIACSPTTAPVATARAVTNLTCKDFYSNQTLIEAMTSPTHTVALDNAVTENLSYYEKLPLIDIILVLDKCMQWLNSTQDPRISNAFHDRYVNPLMPLFAKIVVDQTDAEFQAEVKAFLQEVQAAYAAEDFEAASSLLTELRVGFSLDPTTTCNTP